VLIVPFLLLGLLLTPLWMLGAALKDGHRERMRVRGRFFGPLPKAGGLTSARSLPPPPHRAPSARPR
jgi:hypothetical protein